MAIARTSVSTRVVEADVSSTSWSHTVSGSNTLLLIFFSLGGDATPTVTYAETAMTQVAKRVNSGTARTGFLYRLVNPPAGTNTINVSWGFNGYFKGYAVSLSGVNQSTPLGTAATAGANSNSPSVNVSSAANERVYDLVTMSGGEGASSYTPGAGQTELLDSNSLSYVSSAGSEKAGAATTTMAWTASISANWGIIGIGVRPYIANPSVTTGSATNILINSATLSGEVTSEGSDPVSERGVCWGINENPTTSNDKATSAGTTGAYSVSAINLKPDTLYYYRAYAINEAGTSYGTNQTFKTKSQGGAFLLFLDSL